MHKQKGMTFLGWIGTILIVLLFALATLRLVPAYLQFFKIQSVLRDLPAQMETESNVSPTAIKQYVAKRFDIEAVTIMTSRDLEIERRNESFNVVADYEHKVPFLGNVSFLLDFKTEGEVRR